MIQMITACQLCAKITVENALREEAERIAKMQVAKAFAEEIISPILENLTEVPNRMLLGYRLSGGSRVGLYRTLTEWKRSLTNHGNPKWERDLTNAILGTTDYDLLDYEVVNQYLAEFGFQISCETSWITMTKYSTSTADRGFKVDTLYITMTCPLEEF
jgi:hypothetical protein